MPTVTLSTGEEMEFPEGMSKEDMASALKKYKSTNVTNSIEEQQSPAFLSDEYLKQRGIQLMPRDLLNQFKDFSSGATQAAINLPINAMNLAIKGGNYINKGNAPEAPQLPTFNYAPQNTSAVIGGLTPQIAAAMLTGGGSIGANMLNQGLLGAASEPESPFSGAALGAIGSGAIPGYKIAKSALTPQLEKFQPGKLSENILDFLGQGRTSQINAEKVAHDVHQIGQQVKQDALQHKRLVVNKIGEKRMDVSPVENDKKEIKYLLNNIDKTINKYPDLKVLHSEFKSNPTFENAVKLESQMGTEIRGLKNGFIDTAGRDRIKNLTYAQRMLKKDMDDMMERESPELKSHWKEFKTKYAKEYMPFESSKTLRKISQGEIEGVSPNKLSGIFGRPTKYAKKVLNYLPQETKNALLYNKVHNISPNEPNKLLENLNKLEQSGGYEHLFTPSSPINALRQELGERVKRKEFVTGGPLYKAAKHIIKRIK